MPGGKSPRHHKAGSYELYVRAVGPGGVDPSPVTHRFKISKAPAPGSARRVRGLRGGGGRAEVGERERMARRVLDNDRR
jgi:hypothetical protein